MTTKSERIARYFASMADLGFSYDESVKLRRIEMTLHRWSELECGDSNDYCSWSVERDETTQKPYLVTYPHSEGKSRRRLIADRESGALRRLQQIMAKHADLWFYHQTDPRGCALYIGRKTDLRVLNASRASGVENLPLDVHYTRGMAVCY